MRVWARMPPQPQSQTHLTCRARFWLLARRRQRSASGRRFPLRTQAAKIVRPLHNATLIYPLENETIEEQKIQRLHYNDESKHRGGGKKWYD